MSVMPMIATILFLFLAKASSNLPAGDFVFNGYLNLEGTASLDSQGLFTLTNSSSYSSGRAFYNFPLQFKNSTNGSVVSFSTTFIFAIRPLDNGLLYGHGMSYVISPDKSMQYSLPAQYLGLFNSSNDGKSTNHIVAIELDTAQNPQFDDMNNNHVGIDINSLSSVKANSAGYYMTEHEHGSLMFKNLSLASGNPMQVWVEYNGDNNQLNVTIFPINIPKPETPLLSLTRDLSPYLLQQMYVGFTASTGQLKAYHYILGWSFKLNGQAQDIDLSSLPKLPTVGARARARFRKVVVTLILPIVGSCLLLLTMITFAILVWRQRMRRFVEFEVVEDWEVQYGPLRFSYKDLSAATKCFEESQFLGRGGFGKVYHGVLPKTNMQIAVKRIKSDSKQGMKEFVAEIATIGHLRHPKLVRLLGYCKKKDELFLVYDFMPNGSLEQFLHSKKQAPKQALSWPLRLKIIKDVAFGLLYLHEKWTQVVIHRDIKASNILIDSEFNARLGDFGLAKLYEHGANAMTTHVAGTLGYIAPELTRTGKPDTRSDIFAFGAFLLEVMCGRRPFEPGANSGQTLLVDWVLWCLEKGTILEVVDQNMGRKYETGEVELVLKLGLLCSHAHAAARPTISNVVKYLGGEVMLRETDKLIEILKSQDFAHDSCGRLDNVIISDSIPQVTNSEPFIYVGR